MSRNPFKATKDQTTEFGFGSGNYPDQSFDFSQGGFKSGFPIADPDRNQQLLDLAAHKRIDLQNPAEPDLPAFQGGGGPATAHYYQGNTERYGAQQPLVTERRTPRFRRDRPHRKTYMVRSQETGEAATFVPIQDPNVITPDGKCNG